VFGKLVKIQHSPRYCDCDDRDNATDSFGKESREDDQKSGDRLEPKRFGGRQQ